MPHRNRPLVSQGESIVMVREGETPVIMMPNFGAMTAAMTVNFLRSGSPSVQIVLSLDESVLFGVRERVVGGIDRLAREGETFECAGEGLVLIVRRKVTGSGF